jgi:hypothetical protein
MAQLARVRVGKNGPTPATTDLVDERESYRCARCGSPIQGGSRHHRKLRRFGDHTAANLILLCGSGTTGCHGWVHSHVANSYETGYLVHSWDDPTEVPILLWDGTAVTHDIDGARHDLDRAEAVRILEGMA